MLKRVVQTLRRSAADEAATACALTQLRQRWPISSESQIPLLQAGVPRLLLGALEAHPRSEAVTVSALRVMPSVCIRAKASDPMRSPDVFVSLARAALVAMRAHPQSPPVQQAGCEALAHIRRTGHVVHEVCVAEGAVECVAGALSLSLVLGPPELPIAACEALKTLCTSSPSACERVVAPGSVGTLVRMAAEGDGDSQKTLFIPQGGQALSSIGLRLFSAAAAILAHLVQCSRELRYSVVHSGAFRALLQSPAIAQLDPPVVTSLCRAIAVLAVSRVPMAYEEERCLAVGAAVLILRQFGGQVRSVKLEALQALAQLAKHVAGTREALVSRLLQPDVGQENIREMESVQERLQRVARENEAAREEIARLKAGLEACKDAPERLAELQHAYDLLLHAYYSC
eukprot:m51a1_g14593 hypothetical protein (401) ;mRNA; r:1156843-1158329